MVRYVQEKSWLGAFKRSHGYVRSREFMVRYVSREFMVRYVQEKSWLGAFREFMVRYVQEKPWLGAFKRSHG